MTSYTCPVCRETAEPAARVGAILVCGQCGASLYEDEDGGVRRASGAETIAMSHTDPVGFATLKSARGKLTRS